MHHNWLGRFARFRDIETNPATQYSVHTFAGRFWLLNVPVFLAWCIVSPRTFIEGGILLTGLYSLYANWATDNGAAATARAVMNTMPPNAQLERDIKAAYSPSMSITQVVEELKGIIAKLEKHHGPAPIPVPMPQNIPPTIALVNHSSVYTDAQITPIAQALQLQADDDYGPLCHATAHVVQVPKGGQIPSGAWEIDFFDTSDQPGALGYHDITPQGTPYGKIFVKTDLQAGNSISVTASHEFCEILGDSGADQSVQVDDKTIIAFERCDAVEDDSLGYDKPLPDGTVVRLSDFVTDLYFDPSAPPGSKLDFCDHIKTPLTIANGGYANVGTAELVNGQAEIVWNQQANGRSSREINRHTRGNLAQATPQTA